MFPRIEDPLNANERYLHGIAIRMDALCHMMSSFIEVYAAQNAIATEDNSVTEKVVESAPKRKKATK